MTQDILNNVKPDSSHIHVLVYIFLQISSVIQETLKDDQQVLFSALTGKSK